MSKTVSEVMTENPRVVSRQQGVVDAAKIMLEEDEHGHTFLSVRRRGCRRRGRG